MSSKWFILSLILVIGCGTSPTPFQKEKKNEGYSDSTKDDLKVSTFKANHYTSPAKARLYAEFRAIQQCLSEGYQYANIIDIFDKTISKEVTKTDANVYGPSYGMGMYPFYSRYSSFGVGINYSNVSSRSWNETYVYPVIEVPYTCVNTVYRPKIMFREIPAVEMKHLVKDIKGGVQIQKFLDDSPNEKTLKTDDIILRVNGERIERVYELIQYFSDKRQTVKLEVLRDGVKKSASMKAVDVSDVIKPAEEKIVNEACKEKEVKEKYQNTICKK